MKKVLVSPFDLIPGMRIAETILNDYGAIIISEGTILDDHLINKLMNLNLLRLKVFEEDESVEVEKKDVFKEDYNDNVKVIKGVLNELANGVDLDTKKIDTVADSVLIRMEDKRDIISCLSQIRNVDEYTYTHSVNVSLISMLIGKWLNYGEDRIKLLVQAGLLHDIGKTKVPVEILNKPGKLTEQEYEEMKKHTVYGYRILEKVPSVSKEVMVAVLMHHEREDGSGYPTGLSGDKIHEFAKIVAVADIYDAMTSDRVYRDRESPFEVFQLMEERSVGILNTKVVSAFLNNIAAYYIGDKVRLNNGETGEIIYINPRCVSKPIIKVGEKYLDLLIEKSIKIQEII